MNILSVSGILPIPGYIKINDFVFEFYRNYLKEFNNDKVFFIHPIKYSNKLTQLLLQEDEKSIELNRLDKYSYNTFEIKILKYLSMQRFKSFHALFSYTLYSWNKNYIQDLLRKNRIDLIHAQYLFPDGMLAYILWKKYKIPYIITTHNEIKYFNHKISKKVALKILNNSCFVTPISFVNYQVFKNNNISRIRHIPLGFDEQYLKIEPRPNKNITKIITIAELIKLKNIDKVIHALGKLMFKYDFNYSIIGQGVEHYNLLQLIKEYKLEDRITLLGTVPHTEIGNILSNYDIFIMPSYFETFGRVYFEAMALKIPIICAKNSGIYGLFKEMEEGCSVNHMDINDISRKLEMLLSNKLLRTKIGNGGYELVKNYTWKNLAHIYNQLYYDSTKMKQ